MLGVASALAEEGALDGLSGKIRLCLVPAEEGIEIGYRKSLVEKGVISYTSGKTEFISRGYFDDVDIAFMVHARVPAYKGEKFNLSLGHNGVVRKCSIFKGKAAHAGAHPHLGINALNAATSAINVANSLRETFREKDYFRFHSIITKGGDSVNAVPDEVVVESYVRASSSPALVEANAKVNRAFSSCAAAFGAVVEINDMPGSEPLRDDLNLRAVAAEVLDELVAPGEYSISNDWTTSSTDMGDVSAIVPSIHAYVCGSEGTMHGKDYMVSDARLACCENAKFQLALIEKLLSDGAKRALEVIEKYVPVFKNREEYLNHKKSMMLNRDTVVYGEDGKITLVFKN
jgi:amidohydrolase